MTMTTMSGLGLRPGRGPVITETMARQFAIAEHVCVRPLLRRVEDRQTGRVEQVALPCGSTREAVCPACAHKARVLRMQQCAEGWHRDHEPDPPTQQPSAQQPADGEEADPNGDGDGEEQDEESAGDRRVRSTRRREDAPDLPRVPVEDRTIGRTFTAPNGTVYRPSMFLTLTLGSYGRVGSTGAPINPGRYDYRQAALDALHFARLVDRFWQNLRRCAGYKVQYFAAVEPQRRLAPHLHAAIRGAIPRQLLRRVIAATYVQVWWPPHDQAVYTDRLPVWTGTGYADPDTGELLPTWNQALDRLAEDPDAEPAHVVRFGRQADMQGIIAPSADADRAVRYLTKYLTKSIADAYTDPDNDTDGDGGDGDGGGSGGGCGADRDYTRHVDRLHAELRWLPCSPACSNWLRYGVQPDGAAPGMEPGCCERPAHDRENLGIGGRRVLVSRQWSGKTLSEHRADRAAVVRETLLAAGVVAPQTERMAAGVTLADGTARFVWSDTRPDGHDYARVIMRAVAERQQWRAQYDTAKAALGARPALVGAVDNSFGNPAEPP